MTEIGLADTLDTDRDTAKQYIVAYLAKYPAVSMAMRETEREIMKMHFVEIEGSGAKRRFYDVFDQIAVDKSKKWMMGSAFRMGFNCKIQGGFALLKPRDFGETAKKEIPNVLCSTTSMLRTTPQLLLRELC